MPTQSERVKNKLIVEFIENSSVSEAKLNRRVRKENISEIGQSRKCRMVE